MEALLSCCGSRVSDVPASASSDSLETTRLAGIGVVFKHAGFAHLFASFNILLILYRS